MTKRNLLATMLALCTALACGAEDDAATDDAGGPTPGQDAGPNPTPGQDAGPTPNPNPDAGPAPSDAGPGTSPPPVITSFTTDRGTMRAFLDEATLSWQVQQAASCAISPGIGGVNASAGSTTVSSQQVDVTLPFTLTCTSAAGASATATVSVEVPAVVHAGDFVVTAGNAEQLHGVNRVGGSLSLSALALSDGSFLETLTGVDGEVFVGGNPGFTTLALPHLQQVGAHLTVRANASLGSLSFPSLASVGGSLTVDEHPQLTTLQMPALTSVGGTLYISRAPLLPQSAAEQIASGAAVQGDVLLFRNVLGEITGAMSQSFLCQVPNHWPASNWRYQFQLVAPGTVYLLPPNPSTGAYDQGYEQGTWALSGDELVIQTPSIGTVYGRQPATEMDAIITYNQHYGDVFGLCHSTSLGAGTGFATQPFFNCDVTSWEQNVYYTEDTFQLYSDSGVRWYRETNYTGGNADTVTNTRAGTYFVVGSRVFLVFPTVGDNPWFFATLSGGQLVFDNLGSYNNTCVAQ